MTAETPFAVPLNHSSRYGDSLAAALTATSEHPRVPRLLSLHLLRDRSPRGRTCFGRTVAYNATILTGAVVRTAAALVTIGTAADAAAVACSVVRTVGARAAIITRDRRRCGRRSFAAVAELLHRRHR